MSTNLDEFLSGADNGDGGQETGGQLRQKYEQALAHLHNLRAENETLKTAAAETAVAGTWDKLNVPAPIRGFYQGDKNEKAITEWWEASKGFFNLEQQPAGQQQLTPEQKAQQEQLAAVQQASAIGTDAPPGGFDAALAKAQEVKGAGKPDKAKLAEFYAAAGIPSY